MAKEKKAGPDVSNFDPRVYGLNWNIRSGISTWIFVDKDKPYRSMWDNVSLVSGKCESTAGLAKSSMVGGLDWENKQVCQLGLVFQINSIEPTVGWLYYCSQLFHTGSELTITSPDHPPMYFCEKNGARLVCKLPPLTKLAYWFYKKDGIPSLSQPPIIEAA